jgi:hypothetical protein
MTALLLYATINRNIISLVRAQKIPHVGTKTGQTIKCKLFANYGFIRLSGFLYTFAGDKLKSDNDANDYFNSISVDCAYDWG